MKVVPFLLVFLAVCISGSVVAQKKAAWVSGRVVGENEQPLDNVSVVILGRLKGVITSDSGTFRLKVPADKAFALVFSFTGYKTEQRNFLLNENEEEAMVIRLERGARELEPVVITNERQRRRGRPGCHQPQKCHQYSCACRWNRKPDKSIRRFQQ